MDFMKKVITWPIEWTKKDGTLDTGNPDYKRAHNILRGHAGLTGQRALAKRSKINYGLHDPPCAFYDKQ